jgi:hypothetical protein
MAPPRNNDPGSIAPGDWDSELDKLLEDDEDETELTPPGHIFRPGTKRPVTDIADSDGEQGNGETDLDTPPDGRAEGGNGSASPDPVTGNTRQLLSAVKRVAKRYKLHSDQILRVESLVQVRSCLNLYLCRRPADPFFKHQRRALKFV